MKKIKCAVVGVGYLGRFHAQKIKQIESAELVAVSDLQEEQGRKVAAELGVSFISSYQSLLGMVDAVTIATTTTSHFKIAEFFLQNGIHVQVEKPMTVTVQEAQQLCDIAEKKNLKLQVGHVERFNSALKAAQVKLQNPLFIECHRLAPFKLRGADVDVVLDLMIHDLDVILSLVHSPPLKVQAVGTPVLTQTTDIANARIEFESGAVANITASRVSQKTQRKFRVFQAQQYLSIDFGSGEVNLLTKTGERVGDEIPLEAEAWNLEKSDALLEENRSFIEAIQENKPCVVSGRDGLLALELAHRVRESIAERIRQ